jgi:myo-inositol-1(or 4)-monophosphatase
VTDWLAFCRDAAAAVERALAELPTRTDREPVVALGAGGDETTAIDAAAESAVVSLLESLHAGGAEFTLVSEELGERSFGADGLRVVLDPIDGSMNAKRGIPFFSVSIAVAEGGAMRDVFLGYVFDFGTREEWTARRGEGAFLNGERLDGPGPKEEVEMLSFEATTTELVAEQIADMVGIADRTRIMGSLALSLCHLAAGRVDGVCSLKPARSVDIAAAQLLVRERGLAIDLPDAPPFGEAPLDLAGRSRLVAAASPERCAELFARLSASDRSDAAGSSSRPAIRPP